MNEINKINSSIVALGSLLFVLISGIFLYFWQGKQTIAFVSGIFSVKHIGEDLLYGIVGSLLVMIVLGILLALRKTNLPDTTGAMQLVELLQGHPSGYIVTSTLVVVGEELFFRGVLLLWLDTFMPAWVAVILVSVVFIAMHVKDQYQGQPYLLFYLFVMSLLTGIVTIEQQTLWSACIIHAISNLAASYLIRSNKIRVESTLIIINDMERNNGL